MTDFLRKKGRLLFQKENTCINKMQGSEARQHDKKRNFRMGEHPF